MEEGEVSDELFTRINDLLEEFTTEVSNEIKNKGIRNAFVRIMLPCSRRFILDSQNLWVVSEKASGVGFIWTPMDYRSSSFSAQEIYDLAKWEFGLDHPFIISFPSAVLEQEPSQRIAIVQAIAKSHVESELQRVNTEMNTIQVNPIFGPASYSIDQRLAFILMPFTPELTSIYETVVKPTVENGFSLVCRRADDLKTNKTIMQDIWKSICEARILIADMSNLNPNVMYELGIAHTLGKETILLYKKTEQEIRFPFDLAHIRRIEYENTVPGGPRLASNLQQTLETVLSPRVLS
jgi:hypothetical protein